MTIRSLDGLPPANGDRQPGDLIRRAVLAGPLTFGSGSTQSFAADGSAFRREHGRVAQGSWRLDDAGRLRLFWPPDDYACYTMTWIIDHELIVGVRFTDVDTGTNSSGYYRPLSV